MIMRGHEIISGVTFPCTNLQSDISYLTMPPTFLFLSKQLSRAHVMSIKFMSERSHMYHWILDGREE